jgi:hypothetical protein
MRVTERLKKFSKEVNRVVKKYETTSHKDQLKELKLFSSDSDREQAQLREIRLLLQSLKEQNQTSQY